MAIAPHVPIGSHLLVVWIDDAVSNIRNRRAGKIQRKAGAIGENFDDIRITPFLFFVDRSAYRSHRNCPVPHERPNRSDDCIGANEWQVALHVNQPIRADLARHLGQSIRAAGVVFRSHHHLAAEVSHGLFDAPVVGCDHDSIQFPRLRSALVYMLDHRFAANVSQWLSRKTGRTVTRRDNRHNAHRLTRLGLR